MSKASENYTKRYQQLMKNLVLLIFFLSQTNLYSQESIKLSGTSWTMYLADESYMLKTDTMRLHHVTSSKEIRHGFTFLSDSTFKEVGGKICGFDRKNYFGIYSMNQNTLILDPKNGNKFSFKINLISQSYMELILLK